MRDDPGTGMNDPLLPEDIFNDAFVLDDESRRQFLDRVCATRPELRRRIVAYLEIADADPGFRLAVESEPAPSSLGRYTINGELGRGGMGVVYLAHDPDLGRDIALKRLSASVFDGEAARQRLRREARVLASLNHARIATLFSMEEDGSHVFLTMELVEGTTLRDRLASEAMGLAECQRVFSQIGEALSHAHRKGIIHRDLKPENIMLQADGEVKLLDFGIAKVIDEGAATGNAKGKLLSGALGTPAYMSPEQLAEAPIDERTDIWALGCVMFEALAGRRPLAESGRPDSPIAWSALPVKTPRSIRRLLSDCLRVEPAGRPRSADEVIQRLSTARPLWRRSIAPAFLISLLLAAWYLTGFLRKPDLETYREVNTRTVEAVDRNGSPIWSHEFSHRLAWNVPRMDQEPFVIVKTGQLRGLVVPLKTDDQSIDPLWFLEGRTGERRWSASANWGNLVSPIAGSQPRWESLVPWPGREDPVLAVAFSNGSWYSHVVHFMSLDGNLQGSYYHPGPVRFFGMIKHSLGRELLLLYGINSSARFLDRIVPFETREHCGFVALLELPVQGQGFPYSENMPEERDWPGMAPAHEVAYFLIPPIDAQTAAHADGLEVNTESDDAWKITVAAQDGRLFRLDENLQPLSCYVINNSPSESRVASGLPLPKVLHRLGEQETLIQVPVDY